MRAGESESAGAGAGAGGSDDRWERWQRWSVGDKKCKNSKRGRGREKETERDRERKGPKQEKGTNKKRKRDHTCSIVATLLFFLLLLLLGRGKDLDEALLHHHVDGASLVVADLAVVHLGVDAQRDVARQRPRCRCPRDEHGSVLGALDGKVDDAGVEVEVEVEVGVGVGVVGGVGFVPKEEER